MKASVMLRVLAASALTLGLSAQARDYVIEVNTQADEDGTNPSRCSLREAVTAVNTFRAYGGCPAGDRIYLNVIRLPAGTYELNSELQTKHALVVAGADTVRSDDVNPLSGAKPNRVRPDLSGSGTFIRAASNSRIFLAEASLTLRDLVLTGNGPVAANGGLVYATVNLSASNVVFRNGAVTGTTAAAGNGGAIYIARDGSGLSLEDVSLIGNEAANKGGAIAVSCRVDLVSLAKHDISISRSLLQDNEAALGAGAVELCGTTNASFSATTLSRNRTPMAASGAITYVQPSGVWEGSLTLSHVTAVEQSGHVLSLAGLVNVGIDGSLMGFSLDGANLCHPAATYVTPYGPDGTHNVFGDGSCSRVVSSTGQNTVMSAGALLDDHLVQVDLGTHGLTNYYLPRLGASPNYLVDAGAELSTCKSRDQRGVERLSGTRCDIGSVERLQLTATEDKGENRPGTDRLAIIDVLANDTFAETDSGPVGFTDNSAADPAIIATNVTPDTVCDWRTSEDEEYPGKLVVSHEEGQVTAPDTPLQCSYQVVDRNGGAASAPAIVSVSIRNVSPRARPDRYLRRDGVVSVTFDPLENDDDSGDGKFGELANGEPDWEDYYPIEIVDQPELGMVVGARSGLCPGSTVDPRPCFAPPLTYTARNNLSPFGDTFTYRVYDEEGEPSNTATVTIATDVPEPGKGGGSLDLLGGLLLSLLGLRRFRRL